MSVSRRRRRSLAAAVLLGSVTAVASSVSAAPRTPSIAPGYDMFVTPPDSSYVGLRLADLGVPPVAGVSPAAYVRFGGMPIGRFDFGRAGVRPTGSADTIVRRLGTATPGNGTVRIELVGLLLRSTNVEGYYVTLQSARLPGDVPPAALGKPSPGTLDIAFGRGGDRGTLRSRLEVNYDVRHGSPTGPILYSGSTGTEFVADDLVWQRGPGGPRYCTTVNTNPPTIDILRPQHPFEPCPGEQVTDCHSSFGSAPHEHCVTIDRQIPLIAGVNDRLNGRDRSADFHVIPGG
jgi:hypothetical protein